VIQDPRQQNQNAIPPVQNVPVNRYQRFGQSEVPINDIVASPVSNANSSLNDDNNDSQDEYNNNGMTNQADPRLNNRSKSNRTNSKIPRDLARDHTPSEFIPPGYQKE